MPTKDGKLECEPTKNDYAKYENNAKIRLNKIENR
jgi:hypothetical protein